MAYQTPEKVTIVETRTINQYLMILGLIGKDQASILEYLIRHLEYMRQNNWGAEITMITFTTNARRDGLMGEGAEVHCHFPKGIK